MKTSKKFISLLLALMMVVSVLPLAATAGAIKDNVNTVEKLIQNDNLYSLVEYLVKNINAQADNVTAPVLRIVFLAMNNEDINAIIGSKEVTQLSKEEASKVLVTWLDTKILPDLAKDLESNNAIQIVNNNVPGLQVKLSSVQDAYDTLGQLDGLAIHTALGLLGDAQDVKVTAVKGVKVAGNEYGAVKALFQFLQDNLGIVEKLLKGTLDLGLLNDTLSDNLVVFKQLPDLIKSFIYKLIDKDAAAGEFKDGKMGGDWAKSAYASYSADQMLAAALIKLINGTDDVVSKADADKVLGMSFYGILAEYAKPVYAKFAVEPLNKAIGWLNDWLADQTNETLKAQFKASVSEVTADTFNSVFAGAKDTGILGQLNDILVIAAEHVFSAETYAALKLEKGGNDKLNANLTKVARYVIKLAQNDEEFANMLHVPADILAADADTLELKNMAYIILKPFFGTWFDGNPKFSQNAVASADTLADLGILAVYYTATNTDWLNLDYDFSGVEAKIFNGDVLNDFTDDEASDIILEVGAGIAIGAVKYNKDAMHFTATVDDSSWENGFISIENWGLDFISGLPAVARVHDLKNANSYGPFYKLNVVLNELIDFSFLNDVNDATFNLDLETLLKKGVLENLYEFDVAGIIGIFQKNNKAGNILNGQFIPSVIGVVNRIITSLFEHNCAHATAKDEYDDPNNPCTKFIQVDYDYCSFSGAYFSRKSTTKDKTDPSHVYGEWETKTTATGVTVTLTTCNYKTQQSRTCTICGYVERKAETTASHKWDDPNADDPRCTVCGKSISELKGGEQPPQPTVTLGDVDGNGEINSADARKALRRAVDLETYEKGSKEFIACDVDKNGEVTSADARKILRAAVELEDPTKW